VVRRLLAAKFAVRALTRHPDSAAGRALALSGATVVPGDFDQPLSLERALEGMSGVFAMQTPYEAGASREEAHGIRLAELALRSGVEQFVYSSVASADLPTGVAHFESKGRIEQWVMAAGFHRYTILRPTFFMEMLLSPGNLRTLARGRIELTLAPETRVAMIAVDDIARMAVAAFRDPDGWNGKAVALAGDCPNFAEVAQAFSAALDREILYVQVTPEEIDIETRPKLGTQRWLEAEGWRLDMTSLLSSYPFDATNIRRWARKNVRALSADVQRPAVVRPVRT
jgi:uncharacterized protein YbjT (DUF2867 family)